MEYIKNLQFKMLIKMNKDFEYTLNKKRYSNGQKTYEKMLNI